MHPRVVVEAIRAALPDDGMLFVDNGNAIIWAGHYFEARAPSTYFIDLGLASMGSAVAGVVGGKLARMDRAAVALVGDAAFAMNGFEVHTAVELGVPAVWVVLNNQCHGMVGQGETLLLGEDLGFGRFATRVDCAAFARSVGATGVRVDDAFALRKALDRALTAPGPTVIDAVVDAGAVPPTLERRAASLARFFNMSSS
jgi:acetolactate synthase-1/2/3 large subunit